MEDGVAPPPRSSTLEHPAAKNVEFRILAAGVPDEAVGVSSTRPSGCRNWLPENRIG
ncbi:hypothetical protein OH799_14920 [Nocardia sp. NBC_00881]|uniref:hypothetical protein n=1 Tax=Nocardia sp. NBC_00881 TaxID=2975995 RepID=UPI0038690EB4|nr:hypothetical protein OH799_14920 [Nocardia sp. NBC_00881]